MKSVKKIFMVFLIAHVLAFTLTGCFQKQNVVVVINDVQVTEPFYRIFLWKAQRGTESLYPNIWKLDSLWGKSPEEVVKGIALDSISYNIAMKEKADELGIELSREEKKNVKALAKEAFVSNEALNKTYGIKEKDYEQFYFYVELNKKTIQMMGQSYEPSEDEITSKIDEMNINECSDEATITQVFVNTQNEQGGQIPTDKKQLAYNKACEVLERAKVGEDFAGLIENYSDDSANVGSQKGEYTIKRGEVDANLEKAVFEMASVGEVFPQVVETGEGYVVFKLISFKKATAEEVREKAILAIGEAYATNELKEMGKLVKVEMKDSYADVHVMQVQDIANE